MGIVIDIVIGVIILLCVLLGYKKGLIGMAFSLASFIVAAVIASILFNPLANLIIDNTELDENIQTAFISNFSKENGDEEETDNIPDVIINYIEGKATEIRNNGIEATSEKVAQFCIKGGCFIVIFIVATIVITIVGKIADILAKLPVIKQFNELGGALIGALKGVIIVYVAFAIISFASPILKDTGIYSAINETKVGKYMYENNLLIKIIF